jgi:uncharacterized protein (TIGR00255 family)
LIKSMTAYGRGEIEHNGTLFTAEIKTLNNRYRDIILRLPVSMQELEDMIRAKISANVKRGRVEVSLQVIRKNGEINHNFELNRPLIKSYLDILSDMKNEFGLDDKFKTDFLFQIKDAIVAKPESIDLEENSSAIDELFEHTLESMDNMRIREGKAIEDDLIKRLDLISKYISKIEQRSPLVIDEYREKLKNRIKAIADDIEVDEGRLAQEVALFAGRCDITEEIVRARSHLDQFHEYLQTDDSIGRRLDFLIQELNREINTISSKASDASISLNAVEAKAELEKIREQVQNVE